MDLSVYLNDHSPEPLYMDIDGINELLVELFISVGIAKSGTVWNACRNADAYNVMAGSYTKGKKKAFVNSGVSQYLLKTFSAMHPRPTTASSADECETAGHIIGSTFMDYKNWEDVLTGQRRSMDNGQQLC